MFGLGVNRLGASRSVLGDAIANLFSNGEQGVWYDPSDLTTMFQDDTSGAPAVIGQPVGLMLDKSQGAPLGSEVITNGDFATDSGWGLGNDWSIAGGVASATDSTNDNLRQNRTLVDGKSYLITFTIVSISSGAVLVRFGGDTQVSSEEFSEVGTYTVILEANSTSTSFIIRSRDSFTGSIDNVSVKEVSGNYAIQTTSTKRPVLARHPEGGIRNLLSYTQEFDDDYWQKLRGDVTPFESPIGDTSAFKFQQFSGQTIVPVIRANVPVITGKVYTFSAFVKKGTRNSFSLHEQATTTGIDSYFNILNGTVSNQGSGHIARIQDAGNGWYRCSITYTAAFSASKTHDLRIGATETTTVPDDQGFTYLWGAQLELGSTATQYQHVTDDLRYDITEPFGANSLNYLKFDGADDGMFITGLTSPNTPITAWFGYSATNAESSALKYLIDIQTGRTIFGASSTGTNQVGYYDAGDGLWRGFTTDANALKVLTYDLVEDNAKMRVDGIQEYSDTTYDQLAIGGQIGLFQNAFGTTGNFLAGNLYSCILRAAESTDKEIASTESYVAKKTGVLAQVDGLATLSLDFGGNTYTARNSNGGIL